MPPFAIMGHFEATSLLPPCWAAIHFTQLSTVVSGCHQASFAPLLTLKTCPHMASVSLALCLMLSFLYISLTLRLSRLLHHGFCVTAPVQQKLLRHEGTRLAGSVLRQDFYAHSPRPNVDNGGITSKPQEAIIINQPFSSVFKG